MATRAAFFDGKETMFSVYRRKKCPDGVLYYGTRSEFLSSLEEKFMCLCLSHEEIVDWEINYSCWSSDARFTQTSHK